MAKRFHLHELRFKNCDMVSGSILKHQSVCWEQVLAAGIAGVAAWLTSVTFF
jgi:hypothetical protein